MSDPRVVTPSKEEDRSSNSQLGCRVMPSTELTEALADRPSFVLFNLPASPLARTNALEHIFDIIDTHVEAEGIPDHRCSECYAALSRFLLGENSTQDAQTILQFMQYNNLPL